MIEAMGSVETPLYRRRRRWPWVLAILLVLLGVLATVAEFAARAFVAEQMRSQLVSALNLPSTQPIEVETEGIVLMQVLAGRLDTLHLRADELTLGAVHSDLTATITGVPVDGGAIEHIGGMMRIRSEQFVAMLGSARLPLSEVRLESGLISLAGTVSIFGVGVPIVISVEPAMEEDNNISLRPFSFEVGGIEVDAQGLIDRLGPAGEALAGPFTVCIADRIPRAVEMTELRIVGNAAEIDFLVDGAITIDASLRGRGACAVG